MGQKLLINVAHEETRVALVEAGRIQNLEIDTSRVDSNKNNIYKGVVHRVNASLQAAFVDYGADKQGFLPLSEIHDRYYPRALKGKKVPIQEVLVQGQELMVQVVKDEIGNKGASLTTYIALPGRCLVLMADSDKTGVSRRASSDERQRIKQLISDLPVPEGFGLIVRTAAEGQSEESLQNDLEYLLRLWSKLQERYRTLRGAGVIHEERTVALRFIRDYVGSDVDEILVDDKATHAEILDFCTVLASDLRAKVHLYNDPRPLFSRFQVEDQIDDIFARKIDLPSGGSIVIDQTEALVAIDVNSGKVKTDDIEQTALTTNLEAAAEIARQLRIRDRGGLIVCDFIDMRDKNNIRKVEQAMRDAFVNDKAKVKLSKISEFGLMEVSRQRLQSSIMTGSFTPCAACAGSGRVRSVESSALYLLRRIKETVVRGSYLHVQAKIPVGIANYMLNRKRRELSDIESETGTAVEIMADMHCPPMSAYIELLSQPTKNKRPRRVLQTIDLVRSEVDKRELDEDEQVALELVEERTGWVPPDASHHDLDADNRTLEAEFAHEREILAAQREADESLARQLELAERAKVIEAEALLLREKARAAHDALGAWGRFKTWLFGVKPEKPEPEEDAPVALAAPAKEAPKEERRDRDRDRGRDRDRDRDRGRDGDRGRKESRDGDRDDKDKDKDKDKDRGRRRDGRDRDRDRDKDRRGRRTESGARRRDDKRESEAPPVVADSGAAASSAPGASAKGGPSAEEAPKLAPQSQRQDGAARGGSASEGSGEENGQKKRRRRRRRRGGRADDGAADATVDAADGSGDDSDDGEGDDEATPAVDSRQGQRGDRDRDRERGRGRGPRGDDRPDAPEQAGSSAGGGREERARPAADATPARSAAEAKLPKAGAVLDLRGPGVIDLRSGGPMTGRSDRPAAPKPPAETRAGDAARVPAPGVKAGVVDLRGGTRKPEEKAPEPKPAAAEGKAPEPKPAAAEVKAPEPKPAKAEVKAPETKPAAKTVAAPLKAAEGKEAEAKPAESKALAAADESGAKPRPSRRRATQETAAAPDPAATKDTPAESDAEPDARPATRRRTTRPRTVETAAAVAEAPSVSARDGAGPSAEGSVSERLAALRTAPPQQHEE